MSKRRSHHHESAETVQAEREVARLLQRVEAERSRLGHQREGAGARRRERVWKAAGVALLVAALVAIVGTIVWSLR
jgi:ferric-dicitrate binding protein FerR (iron transport regulator)